MIALRVNALKTLAIYLAFMWVLFIASIFINLDFGIVPRSGSGLFGILSAPFLHANLFHIISNTIGLTIFGCIYVMLEGDDVHFPFWFITLAGGVATWLFARDAMHIGASGVIFGLYGYLISIGMVTKQIKYMIISMVVIGIYGWMLVGILPTNPRISFEGHLFGLIAGIALAKIKHWEIKNDV